MTSQSKRILEACEFDDMNVPIQEQRVRASVPDAQTLPSRRFGYRCGAKDENARLLPIIQALLEANEEMEMALNEAICGCYFETRSTCNSCSALTKNRERMEGMGK